MGITKSNLSLEDLEQFRDEDGYIDLDKAGLEVAEESREARGNEHRIKNWVDFNGAEVLIKEEAQLDQRNYGVYAQLIMVELAKQLGLPAAEYDLMKYKGKFGSISHKFGDQEKEIFQSVYELIETVPLVQGTDDVSDYLKVEKMLEEKLETFGDMTDEEREAVIRDRRKQKMLQLFACENDGHIQNEGVLLKKTDDGRTIAVCAPMFDNETAFFLDNTIGDLEKTLENNQSDNFCKEVLDQYMERYETARRTKQPLNTRGILGLDIVRSTLKEQKQNLINISLNEELPAGVEEAKTDEEKVKKAEGNFERRLAEVLDGDASLRIYATGARPKIAFVPTKEMLEEFGEGFEYVSMADSTMALMREFAMDDPELDDFMYQLQELDMEAAIEAVEEKIKAPVPQLVRDVAIPAFEMRKRDLNDVLMYQRTCQTKERDASIIHTRVVGREERRREDSHLVGHEYSSQIVARSIAESVSMKEGLGALYELADVTRTKEQHEQDKKDDKVKEDK